MGGVSGDCAEWFGLGFVGADEVPGFQVEAGQELGEFIKIAQANSGITATQDIPTYTNLSEGIGVFTSRNVANYTGFGLTDATLDSLKNGSITGHLNFQ